MKALVLCGGLPQAALIKELKSRGIYTILADMNPNVMARPYADAFFPVSVLDVEAVKELAVKEKVDMVLTACADQVLLIQAQVSEELGLPCYIDYKTAKDVSSKELMKKVFSENGIPTSKYYITTEYNDGQTCGLAFPLIVKPIDSYSSRGVRKVYNTAELKEAISTAVKISRSGTAIVEEFVEGNELTVDIYVEDGKAHVLCISNIDKIPGNDRFIICRTRYPAQISNELTEIIEEVANQIACAFKLKNSPMLVQLITDGDNISVVEFCARTGGGDKFCLVKQVSHFDVIKAVVDLTLGSKPQVEKYKLQRCILNEFIYAMPGVFDHMEGFTYLKQKKIIDEFYCLKSKETCFGEVKSSGDRAAYVTITGADWREVVEKLDYMNRNTKILDKNGRDIMKHTIIEKFLKDTEKL